MTSIDTAQIVKVKIQFGVIYVEMEDDTEHEAGRDLTFGIRNPQSARYRCNCGAYFDLPRDIAGHLTAGTCTALAAACGQQPGGQRR